MVGNLLDNAFEAAKQTENGKIEFSLYTIDGKSCVVSVINTALTAPKCENETLVSAKPDANSHGYGIKSIKKTAEKPIIGRFSTIRMRLPIHMETMSPQKSSGSVFIT